MIFVTVGTSQYPFDRLLQAVADLQTDEEVVAQYGPSAILPSHATCVPFMDYDRVLAHMRRARVVVSHAGVGTILSALLEGKRPVVVARRAAYHEAVDDHQLDVAEALAPSRVIVHVRDLENLSGALSAASAGTPMRPEAGGDLARAVAHAARSSFA